MKVWCALVLAVALAALGCETPLERAYGRSQRAYLERSIENPDAAAKEDADGPESDGISAAAAMAKERQREAEAQPKQSGTESMINVEIGN